MLKSMTDNIFKLNLKTKSLRETVFYYLEKENLTDLDKIRLNLALDLWEIELKSYKKYSNQ